MAFFRSKLSTSPATSQSVSPASLAPPRAKRGRSKALITALLLGYGAYWLYFPRVGALRTDPPRTTAFIEDYQERQRDLGRSSAILQTWRPLSEISTDLKDAVLLGEDDAFFTHDGVDFEQMKRAIDAWEAGKKLRGASTITQQLAKNLYLSNSRNPLRKLRELLITRRLERTLSKERILELYLNVIEWGPGVYGAEAASQYYFHRPAESVTDADAAFLAAIIPNPVWLTDKAQRRQLQFRKGVILNRLHRSPSKFLD